MIYFDESSEMTQEDWERLKAALREIGRHTEEDVYWLVNSDGEIVHHVRQVNDAPD